MPRASETVEHILELLKPWGAVTAKAMFGGWGLYREGLFFALVADDVLYLKTDGTTRAAFDEAGLEPFTYVMRGEPKTMASYRRAPDEAMESPGEMARWARLAYEAAVRAQAGKPRRIAAKRKSARA